MSDNKTFVTGASGHVGANLVRALLARGEAVKCLVRPSSNNAALAGLDVELAPGDLRDAASLERGLRGCSRLYHVAAFISLRKGERDQLFDANIVGTKNILDVAERVGVERAVVCSSFGAVGINRGGAATRGAPIPASDETHTVNPFDHHLDYELSKAVQEIEVMRAALRGFDVVLVNPSGVVGPHDYKPSSIGQTIIDVARRKMKAYVPGAFDFVAVRDVVEGHLLAMDKGKRGERYILGGELLTLDRILDHLSATLGVRKPPLRLPASVMWPLSHVSSFVMQRFFPTVPARFTPGAVRLLTSGKRADTSKAQRELGYRPSSVLDAFTEQVEFFKSRGVIA